MTPTAPPIPTRSLKHRFVGTAGWALGGHFGAQAVRFASNLVLTRLLAPEMFGVMSVIYVVFTGIGMLCDVGLGALASQSPRGNEPKFLNTLWLVQVGRGALVTVMALGAAGLLALVVAGGGLPSQSVYADPRLPWLIAALSVIGVSEGLQSTRILAARRNLSIARLTKMDLVCQFATTAFILAWAEFDPSVRALAAGWLFGSALHTVLSHTMLPGQPNRLEWDRAAFEEIRRFGTWVVVSSPLSFLLGSGDRILLGAYLDAPTMGLYSIALLLIAALQGAVQGVIGAAVLPALSEVVRDKPGALRQTLYRIRRPLAIACLVPAGAMTMLGSSIVRWLYDPRYAGAGWMLSAVAMTLAVSYLSVFDQCLIALRRVKRLSLLNALRLATLCAFVPLGHAVFGARGAVAGIAATALVNAVLTLAVQNRMGLLDLRRELAALPLFGAGIAAGALIQVVAGAFAR